MELGDRSDIFQSPASTRLSSFFYLEDATWAKELRFVLCPIYATQPSSTFLPNPQRLESDHLLLPQGFLIVLRAHFFTRIAIHLLLMSITFAGLRSGKKLAAPAYESFCQEWFLTMMSRNWIIRGIKVECVFVEITFSFRDVEASF